MVLQQRISLLLLFSVSVALAASCDSRCLANLIIAKKMKSAPQGSSSSVTVNITSMKYETLSFDTKEMQMSCRVTVYMRWTDPELGWGKNTSNMSAVMLPVDKIWTPGLVLDNAIDVTMKPQTEDVLVNKEGTVDHAVILFIAVSCDINLFTYPFVTGDCPVAINGWNKSSFGLILQHSDNISMSGSTQSGEWNALKVAITSDPDFQYLRFVSVTLSINPFSAVVTLILPSILIMLADLVSFSLAITGGERNNFKVTLVLSFTMFLLILNDRLSSGGACSPLLHYHFCFCLVNLVLSMVLSIVLTHLTTTDSTLNSTCSKKMKRQNAHLDQDEDAGAIAMKTPSETEMASIQKIVQFLERVDLKKQEAISNEAFVGRLDKICFLFFLFIDIIYIICVVVITTTNICKPQKLKIWNKDELYDLWISNYNNETDYIL
ncbi:5-hydroxytryptamine receptor 3A-like isoform X2 [Danio aesculapii]|uniref:5-hydroxytryptamine receptor 3A-like isoform X2 n=1 Tax=Danio aesculapii TaxID=1142201 RepID=UPI0024BF3B88|nr:5-hydroxytryptamine receptor 3A-like isoform X2 [Danio aesculapii]